MDAIDGKQARRTGMASALGEMFDHGCGKSLFSQAFHLQTLANLTDAINTSVSRPLGLRAKPSAARS
jgi:phosphatidylglycerophosphate synthase